VRPRNSCRRALVFELMTSIASALANEDQAAAETAAQTLRFQLETIAWMNSRRRPASHVDD